MKKIHGTDEAWDSRELGTDEAHVRVAPSEFARALDAASGMQTISIRLPKDLIDAYKLIASFHGVGYQPLMRDVLQRFVPEAMKEILEHHQARAAQAEDRGSSQPEKKAA